MPAEKNVEFMNSSSKYYENTNLLRVFFIHMYKIRYDREGMSSTSPF